ncbi:Hypothetical predicted protein [Pelobates cultripes]|nr:Hypothetical predicted protein [Pelobates cultripes]
MAGAERTPNNTEDNPDILARLDRIFDNFWRKLENKIYQPVWSQPGDCTLHKPTPVMKQKIAAATTQRAPTWRQGGKRAPSRGPTTHPGSLPKGKSLPRSHPPRSATAPEGEASSRRHNKQDASHKLKARQQAPTVKALTWTTRKPQSPTKPAAAGRRNPPKGKPQPCITLNKSRRILLLATEKHCLLPGTQNATCSNTDGDFALTKRGIG